MYYYYIIYNYKKKKNLNLQINLYVTRNETFVSVKLLPNNIIWSPILLAIKIHVLTTFHSIINII